jgi:hypothetical protein
MSEYHATLSLFPLFTEEDGLEMLIRRVGTDKNAECNGASNLLRKGNHQGRSCLPITSYKADPGLFHRLMRGGISLTGAGATMP